jgi:tetratricopeptide (TPR) repeat protein
LASEYSTLAESRLALLKLVVEPQNPPPKPVIKDSLKEITQPEIEFIDSVPLPIDSVKTDTIKTKVKKDSLKMPIKTDTIETLVKPDTGIENDSAAVHFHLAEIYNLNLKKYERALSEYEKVYKQYPKSSYAPKSLFAQAWIYKNILGAQPDTSQYNPDYKRILNTIINNYPNTEYAAAAQEMLKP